MPTFTKDVALIWWGNAVATAGCYAYAYLKGPTPDDGGEDGTDMTDVQQGMAPIATGTAPRRPVGERWFYDPVIDAQGSSSVSTPMLVSVRASHNDGILGPTNVDSAASLDAHLNEGSYQSPEDLSHLTSFFNTRC